MKRLIILVAIFGALIFMASYTVLKTSGSHPGSTGAPGDLTCSQFGCHIPASVTHDSGLVNNLLISSSDTSYLPGNTYTLTLQVTMSHTSKFGFELVALKDSTNTNIGNFTVMDPVRTQKLNYQATATDLRYSMTHQSAGTTTTSTAGAIEWKMKWTAPTSNVGPITFWYATNCTNNDGKETGDAIYLSSFQIKPSIFTGLKEENRTKNLSVRYEREQQSLQLGFGTTRAQEAQVLIYDVNGKLILDQKIQTLNGDQNQKLRLPDNLAKGAYVVKLGLSDKAYTTKILID